MNTAAMQAMVQLTIQLSLALQQGRESRRNIAVNHWPICSPMATPPQAFSSAKLASVAAGFAVWAAASDGTTKTQRNSPMAMGDAGGGAGQRGANRQGRR